MKLMMPPEAYVRLEAIEGIDQGHVETILAEFLEATAETAQEFVLRHPKKVERLVLYAPVWIRTTPSLVQTGSGPTPAYRTGRPCSSFTWRPRSLGPRRWS